MTKVSRTFITLAELIRPFLDMFSISSMLVKPLDLQAIIGGNVGGVLKTRQSWREHPPGRLQPDSDVIQNSQFTASVKSRAQKQQRWAAALAVFLVSSSPATSVGLSSIMAVGQPTRPKYQRLARPHQSHPDAVYFTNPSDSIPTGNVPVFLASPVLARPGFSFRTCLCSPGRLRTLYLRSALLAATWTYSPVPRLIHRSVYHKYITQNLPADLRR